MVVSGPQCGFVGCDNTATLAALTDVGQVPSCEGCAAGYPTKRGD